MTGNQTNWLRLHGKRLLFLLTLLFPFLFLSAQPKISSFTPAFGPVGTTVTINGSGIGSSPAGNVVYFGPVKAAISAATATSITVTVPQSAGYSPITVTAGNRTAASSKPFTITFASGEIAPNSFVYNSGVDSIMGIESPDIKYGDFDNDGKPDLAVVGLDNTLAIYRNTSKTSLVSFAPKVEYATGDKPFNLSVGDLDGDGKLDIVVSNQGSNTVSVYRNTSTGGVLSFAAKMDVATGMQPAAVAIADMNNDGLPDLAVSCIDLGGNLTILKNQSSTGSLSFAPKNDITVLAGASNIVAADFNGDGKTDLAVNSFALNKIAIVQNSSSGATITFAAAKLLDTGPFPSGLAAADVDGDGKPDLAVTNANENTIYVFRNTSGSSISFANGLAYNSPYNPTDVQFGDIDGDGKPDMAVMNSMRSFSIFRNLSVTGGGIAFGNSVDFPSQITHGKLLLNDIDGDSRPDVTLLQDIFRSVICLNRVGTPYIERVSAIAGGAGDTIHLRGANFTNVAAVTFGGVPAASFAVDDNNNITAVLGAGVSGDIVVTTPVGKGAYAGFTYYYPPFIDAFTPTTAFQHETLTITGHNFSTTTAVSFGGVPAASFAVIDSTKITAVVGAGASGEVAIATGGGKAKKGGFTYIPPPEIVSFSPATATVGTVVTINGKNLTGATEVSLGGIPADSFTVVSSTQIKAKLLDALSGDVKVATPSGWDTLGGFLFVHPPSPEVTASTPHAGNVGTTVTISGKNFSMTPGENVVYFGAVKAKVTAASATSLQVVVPVGAISKPISVTTFFRTAFAPQPFIVTFPNGGRINEHSFGSGVPIPVWTVDVKIGDLDGDGKSDVISTGFGAVSIIPNASTYGNPTFGTVIKPPSFGAKAAQVVDLDGDGKLDLLTLDDWSNAVCVYFNISTPGFINFDKYWTVGLGDRPRTFATADIDGDGRMDVVIGQDQSISILRNTSVAKHISFAPLATLVQGYSGVVKTGDVDGDGRPDLVVLGRDAAFVIRNTTVGENISFDTPVTCNTRIDNPTLFGPTDVILADVDGDEKQDLAIANTQASQSVSLFRNTSAAGKISFAERQDFMTSPWTSPFALDATDVNGDGKLDLVMTHEYVPVRITALENTSTAGAISFSPFVNFTENINGILSGICSGDLDGDGKPEMIAAGENSGGVFIFKNKTNWPHIDSFTPRNGVAGSLITISGSNFEGTTAVSIGGVAVKSFSIVSSTTITAIVATSEDGYVKVTTSIGVDSASSFVYGLQPVVKSFSPTSGGPGTLVTIKGANFTGATDVMFGVLRSLEYTIENDSTIKAKVYSFGESGKVSVTTRIGTGSLDGFTFVPPAPIITSFSPSTGVEGTYVDIRGEHFLWTGSVTFGGVPAKEFKIWNDNYLQVVVGKGASGAVAVSSSGGADSMAGFVFVLPPVVNAFVPSSGRTGDTIRISGLNFAGASSVSFGGVPAKSFVVDSASQLRAVVGNGNSGAISVTSVGGVGTKAGFDFIAPPPSIVSFTPASGRKGDTIHVAGNNFKDVTAVRFGSKAAVWFTVRSETSLDAIVGEGESGTITVAQPSGTASFVGFTYIPPPPVIESFLPATGKTSDKIIIRGQHLMGATVVTFGGTPAQSFTVDSATGITAIVGSGTTGQVSVTTPGGATFQAGFTYQLATSVGEPVVINSQELMVSPNPGRDVVVIKHPASYRTTLIKFVDMLGRTVKQVVPSKNAKQTTASILDLPSGVYQIVWTDGKRNLSRTFVAAR